MRYENIYIDLPAVGGDTWKNVSVLKNATKSEAVAWIRENIGYCDEDGKVSLLTLGEPATADNPSCATPTED